jgi:arginyl-tRNA synthetase
VRKADGAALYATTDVATLRYRVDEWKADEVWYVTDVRQGLHFAQLFATAERMGLAVVLRHVAFGAILGADRKPFKTREGGTVRLESLLDEGVDRAAALVRERRPELPDERARQIAEVVGIGSIKYNDLAQNRHLDYVFDWSKMLAFDGNTAPYVLNALVRCLSILRKAGDGADAGAGLGSVLQPRERELLVQLLRFDETLDAVLAEQRPHHLCFYLFELAGQFHSFFEECPVLKAETPELRAHRLALVRVTANTLRTGCGLLGLQTLEEM